MGTNKHTRDRVQTDRTSPPGGRNDMTDRDHTLRAGHDGTSQRKSAGTREPSTRDEGRDDRRSGSDSGKS